MKREEEVWRGMKRDEEDEEGWRGMERDGEE